MKTKAEIENAIKKCNMWFVFFAVIGSLAALLGTVIANVISLAIMFFALAVMAFDSLNANKTILEMKRMSGEE